MLVYTAGTITLLKLSHIKIRAVSVRHYHRRLISLGTIRPVPARSCSRRTFHGASSSISQPLPFFPVYVTGSAPDAVTRRTWPPRRDPGKVTEFIATLERALSFLAKHAANPPTFRPNSLWSVPSSFLWKSFRRLRLVELALCPQQLDLLLNSVIWSSLWLVGHAESWWVRGTIETALLNVALRLP